MIYFFCICKETKCLLPPLHAAADATSLSVTVTPPQGLPAYTNILIFTSTQQSEQGEMSRGGTSLPTRQTLQIKLHLLPCCLSLVS